MSYVPAGHISSHCFVLHISFECSFIFLLISYLCRSYFFTFQKYGGGGSHNILSASLYFDKHCSVLSVLSLLSVSSGICWLLIYADVICMLIWCLSMYLGVYIDCGVHVFVQIQIQNIISIELVNQFHTVSPFHASVHIPDTLFQPRKNPRQMVWKFKKILETLFKKILLAT